MAVTNAGKALTEAHRLEQARIGVQTARQLRSLWALLNAEGRTPTVDEWLGAVTTVLGRQHGLSAAAARDYYSAFRLAEIGEAGFAARGIPTLNLEAVRASMVATGPYRLRQGIRRGLTVEEASQRAMISSAGEGVRIALDGGRQQIIRNVQADSRALGWVRVTDGDPCAFCAMLASRGPVFKGRATAIAGTVFSTSVNDYRAHARCGCTAEPVYRADTEWPGRAREFHDLWNRAQQKARSDPEWASSGTKNDALNNFRKLVERGSSGDS